MSILSDNLYLENIEEYVEDDRRIVTCKWLSRTLSVPVDAAKKMLYQYVSQRSRPLSVMYCTTGRTSSQEEDEKKIVVNLVSEKELEDTKSQYSELWDVHVYSVQLSPVKESCVLYSSDYQVMMKDHLIEYSKWNNISCDITSRPLPPHTEVIPATAWSSENCTRVQKILSDQVLSTEHKGTKTVKKDTTKKKKPLSKASVSSFFNEKPVKTKPLSIDPPVVSSLDGNVTSTVKEEPISPTDISHSINPTSNINVKEIKLETSVESPRKLEKSRVEPSSTGLQDSDFEDESDVSSDTTNVFKSKTSEKKTKKYTKATNKVSGKATDTSTSGKKRKRVLKMASSSDDDSDHAESSDTKTVLPVSQNQDHQCKRRRKHERRLVAKNTLAEDGSMVTEKTWEDVSTDASSNEENDNSVVAIVKKRSEPKVEFQSPNKRTKQSSLMSFFKK